MSGAPDPLPPHRVALRAAIGAGVSAPLLGLLATLLFFAGPQPVRLRELPLVWTSISAGVGTACALLVVAEGVAARLRPALRPPAMLTVGASGGLVIACAVAWVLSFLEGGGTADAWRQLGRVLDWCLEHPQRALPCGGAVLLPLTGLGTVRTLPRPAPLVFQALVGVGTGLAAFALMCAALQPPRGREFFTVGLAFVGLPGCAPLTLWLGERAEAALLAWLERRGEE